MVRPQRLARERGDGSSDSIDDEYDSTEYEAKEPQPPTQTTFHRHDIENLQISEQRKERLRRMRRRQEGKNPGEVYYQGREDYKQQNRSEWKRRVVSTFASQLDLTTTQKERVKHLVNDILDINSFGYYSTEQVVLATANVVAREDGRWIEDEKKFRELMDESGLVNDGVADLDSLKTLRRMVRERLPNR